MFSQFKLYAYTINNYRNSKNNYKEIERKALQTDFVLVQPPTVGDLRPVPRTHSRDFHCGQASKAVEKPFTDPSSPYLGYLTLVQEYQSIQGIPHP